jgi:hypothetical protein
MNLCSGPGIQFWYMGTHELVSSIPDGRITRMTEDIYIYFVVCRPVARQCQKHTCGQQYRNSVFYICGWAVAMQRACCDVTQQYVTITWHVSCSRQWRHTTVVGSNNVTCLRWCVVCPSAIYVSVIVQSKSVSQFSEWALRVSYEREIVAAEASKLKPRLEKNTGVQHVRM